MKPALSCRYLASVAALLAFGCSAESPGLPGPQPTPTPPPVTSPTPVPTPTPDPVTSKCLPPTPPPIHGMKIKVHVDQGYRKLLDSRPIVQNLDGYCAKVGASASAPYCDTRLEGDLQREACDALAVGKAEDTGRYGPTWTRNDEPCGSGGEGQDAGCVNSPDNQFLVIAKGPGHYLACPREGPCGGFEIP
jgi:hypothetical protein